MSNNLKNCIQKLNFIATVNNKNLRRKLLNDIPSDCLFKALNEIARNAFNENSPLYSEMGKIVKKVKNSKERKKFINVLKKLSINQKNKSIRKRLIHQSGGFLPYILPVVSTLLSLIP